MKQVVVFPAYSIDCMTAYGDVENAANMWFQEHPDAVLLASHSSQAAGEEAGKMWTEFALTLIVDISEQEGGDTPQVE